MDEYIARTIINELRTSLPAAQLTRMLELYSEFAELETPVEKGIRTDWMDNVSAFYQLSPSMRANHKILLNSESFFKKVLYVVDEQAYQSCIADPRLGLYTAMEYLGLLKYIPGHLKINSCDFNRIDDPVTRAIIQTYQLRNNAAHSSENWSITQMLININAVMVATLQAVWINRTKIQNIISTSTSNSQFGIDTLMKQIVKSYDRKLGDGFRYVPLMWESDNNLQSKQMKLEDLLEEKHILLAGEAGCGKTTSLDYLEYQAAKNYINDLSTVIPVKIALIDESPDSALQDIICRKLNIPTTYCDTLLEKRRIYLLIDGLNELSADLECKKTFIISIEQFIARNPGIFVVVTDRKYSPISVHIDKTYHLKRMGKQDILNYAKTRPEVNAQIMDMMSDLLDRPDFMELEYTPLLVNQLLLALSFYGKVPEDITELVGVYLEALLKREYQEKRDLNAAPGKLDLILMKIAMEKTGEEGIAKFHAMRLCADIMREYGIQIQSDACINLAIQLGILKQSGDNIDFVLDDYRTYYLLRAIEQGL